MGNRLCCGCRGPWSCPSVFQRKKKTGSQARGTQKLQEQLQQNGTKTPGTAGPSDRRHSRQPDRRRERSVSLRSEESNLHYADIQVCSRGPARHTSAPRRQPLEKATEYAVLRFPQATPRYDSKNGTLV
ncbi:uncharacterized protein C11orf52 homolog [Sorex araneus]|uniref:uncharacterized protein C11orf52 homolog n=1 Tax=Sorex araneus TaxID=42254 RepID=UPI0003316D0A|nr:uncharacterized protein C11orf52 homolog [Sorex araneus]